VLPAVQIVMLGVCTSGRNHEELSLQPLPLYTLPTDGVIMCCCAATASGRVFLGGADGHVYEVQYNAADKWLQRRVAKVRPGAARDALHRSVLHTGC
jgi:nuclear pore complex protein Nup155